MAEVFTLEAEGLTGFRLDQAGGRRFVKDVLRVGSWVHPTTGQKIDVDRSFLEELARNTNAWLQLGNKVYFPDGHTSSALANLGTWSDFHVEGDTLKARVDVADDEAAKKVGKTITDVSPAIHPNVRASTGEKFSAVILHVAATPEPVIPGQANFVRLSRAPSGGSVTALGHNTKPQDKTQERSMSKLLQMTRKLLGMPEDTSEDAICAKLEGAKLSFGEDDLDEEEKKAEMSAKLSRALEENGKKFALELSARDSKIKALEEDRVRRIKKAAEDKINLARQRSVELGVPLEEDTAKDALALLSRDDEESQRLGDKILKLAHDRATAAPIYSRELENPGRKVDAETPNPVLLAAGYKAKRDEKGRIEGYSRS